MVNLRMYRPDQIEAAARFLNEQRADGSINIHEYGYALSRLVFRDLEGAYWAYNQGGGNWHRFGENNWEIRAKPPQSLEGATDSGVSELPDEPAIASESEIPIGTAVEPSDGVPGAQGFQVITDLICKAYADGKLCLEDAQALLAERCLFDRHGRAWNVGARTKGWYVYESSGWERASSPPAEDEWMKIINLPRPCPNCGKPCRSEEQCAHCGAPLPALPEFADDEASARFMMFLLREAVGAPEVIAEAWDPPAWYPDAIHIDGFVCPTCQTENKAGSNFCNRCGTVLAPLQVGPAPPASMKFCTHCGAELKPGRKFCSNCGKQVAEKAEHGLPR